MKANEIAVRMNKLNSADDMVKDLIGAIGGCMDLTDAKNEQIIRDMFISTCSAERLGEYEKEAGISPAASQTEEDRRSAVIARWRSEGKCDIELLKITADSWKYGKTNIDFVSNKLQISFNDKGIPTDLDGLKAAIEEVKPAHIDTVYIFVYTTWDEVKTKTWNEVKTMTWDELKVR